MGIYINPKNQSKEEWLFANSVPPNNAYRIPSEFRLNAAIVPAHWVCLVNNGAFTAAGVAYNTRELQAFSHEDGRDKLWFIVPDEKIEEIAPGSREALEAYDWSARP